MNDTTQIQRWLSTSEPDPDFVRRARQVGVIAALIGLPLALTVPLGWILGIPILRPVNPTVTPTHVIGVLFSILLAVSVILLYRGLNPRWLRPLWIMMILAVGEVLLEYLTPGELPFASAIRFLDPFENQEKLAPNAAMCTWFVAVGAMFLTRDSVKTNWVGQTFCFVAVFITVLALIGHAYAVEPFYALGNPYSVPPALDAGNYSGMTATGAVNHLLIALAFLLVHPGEGMMRMLTMRSSAGLMSRRLYTTVLAVPPLLGFFTLVSSEIWKWYDIPFAISLLTLTSVVFFAGVIAFTSRRLERTDLSRARAEEGLHASRERLRELSGHIQIMQEEERLRIAREVHDELGQSLTALKMDVSMLRSQVPQTEDMERRTSSIIRLVNSTIRSVQRISSELRPSILDDLGLAAAIEWQAREFEKRSGVACELHLVTDQLPIEASQSTAIFRIFQETLTNVARHANAGEVDIRLERESETIKLTVTDDGVGLTDQGIVNSQSLGIMGMRERAALAGGSLEIFGAPGVGTTVAVTMPINVHADLVMRIG